MHTKSPSTPHPSLRKSAVAEAVSAVSRREFIRQSVGVGAALALPLGLASCGGGGDDESPQRPPPEVRTLFFNLAHEAHEAHAGKTYYLTGGGQRIPLVSVKDNPAVLARVRTTHKFLAAVPDDQITHHVEGATFATDSVTLCYVSTDVDPQAGTWTMSSMQLVIPQNASAKAHAVARQRTPSGPLPLSAKRRHYGLPAAQTEQDLREERDLLDPIGHAATMVGGFPDLMSLEPGSAHVVHSVHIDTDSNVEKLGRLLADQNQPYGPALPQQAPGADNPTGWGTLQPLLDDNGVPMKNMTGLHKGRVLYVPNVHSGLHQLMRAAMLTQASAVKDDVSLGADITGVNPAPTSELLQRLNGALWLRHDGVTHVDQSPGVAAAASDAANVTLTNNTAPPGFLINITDATFADRKVSLALINFFLFWRGTYLQFLDANSKVIPLADMPEYKSNTIVPGHDSALDTSDTFRLGLIGPAFTILAVPVVPGWTIPSFTVPQKASKVRILASGMSMQANNNYPDTVTDGAVMTAFINYATTTFLAAGGAAIEMPAIVRVLLTIGANLIASELIATVLSIALGTPNWASPQFWGNLILNVAKAYLGTAQGPALTALSAAVSVAVGAAGLPDSIPVFGTIAQAISVALGAANILETTIEIAATPWTWTADLVITHDLTVALQHDDKDDSFPKAANHYQVTAMFDGGMPVVQSFALAGPTNTLSDVVFKGVPLGGTANVQVGFYQQGLTPADQNIALGNGSTGNVPNNVDSATIKITETAFPIDSTTVYRHQQKTVLDAAGKHRWVNSAAPTATAFNTDPNAIVTVSQFRSLSVRQGTANAAGYVGYAWQGFGGDTQAQRDRVANINTDTSNGGINAQSGYVQSGGFSLTGVRVAYSLLSRGQANFYVDTNGTDQKGNFPVIRQVVLEPAPGFAGVGQAFGVLNFASDVALLHPSGHVVSLNTRIHKLETHLPPAQPMADAQALLHLRAQPKAGRGTLPGLVNSPVAMAISTKGEILVLEAGNNRIQALDLAASPVRHFAKQPSPYFLELAVTDGNNTTQYLDMAVEYSGYIYVLSYDTNTQIYRLDLYHPDQSGRNPIATTLNFNAAKLAADLWRNVYALNYEVLVPASCGAQPPAASCIAEPSLSLWTPCAAGVTC